MVPSRARETALGVVAVLLWSTTIALGRRLSEQLGMLTAGALVFGLAGAGGLVVQVLTGRLRSTLGAISPSLVLRSGSLFVLYELCLYLALGLSRNRAQVLEVALVHYLWPMLTLVFAVLSAKTPVRAAFWLGAAAAMAGVVLAMTQDRAVTVRSFGENLRGNGAPFAIALMAAVLWALYSVSGRGVAREASGRTVMVWMALTGVVLGVARLFRDERTIFDARAGLELAYMAISSNLAYAFWDRAMRGGNVVLVASFSYLTPLLSTLVSSLYLGVGLGVQLWAGCALVLAGGTVCNWMVRRPPAPAGTQ